jgi:hypothetical protein
MTMPKEELEAEEKRKKLPKELEASGSLAHLCVLISASITPHEERDDAHNKDKFFALFEPVRHQFCTDLELDEILLNPAQRVWGLRGRNFGQASSLRACKSKRRGCHLLFIRQAKNKSRGISASRQRLFLNLRGTARKPVKLRSTTLDYPPLQGSIKKRFLCYQDHLGFYGIGRPGNLPRLVRIR